jgi:hypothetical protein
MRVHRGGGYKDGPGKEEGKPLRLAFRDVEYPYNSRRSIGFRCVRALTKEELWLGSTEVGSNSQHWFYLDWFGYYYKPSNDWIFHPDLGWVYPTGKGSYDNWIYFPKCGWMWTARFAFPYFLNDERNAWYLLQQNKKEYGWFLQDEDRSLERWGRVFSR